MLSMNLHGICASGLDVSGFLSCLENTGLAFGHLGMVSMAIVSSILWVGFHWTSGIDI